MLHFCYLSLFIISVEVVKIRFHSYSHCTWQPVVGSCCYIDFSYATPPPPPNLHTHTISVSYVSCLSHVCVFLSHMLFLSCPSVCWFIITVSASQFSLHSQMYCGDRSQGLISPGLMSGMLLLAFSNLSTEHSYD